MQPSIRRQPIGGLPSRGATQEPVPRIDLAVCSRCGLCLVVCTSGAVSAAWTADGAWLPWIDERRCIRCDDCELACPELAVETQFEIVLEEGSQS